MHVPTASVICDSTPDALWGGGYALGSEWIHKEGWQHPELHGNLPGWIQYRKTLPGEAIAPLPEGYEYRQPTR